MMILHSKLNGNRRQLNCVMTSMNSFNRKKQNFLRCAPELRWAWPEDMKILFGASNTYNHLQYNQPLRRLIWN